MILRRILTPVFLIAATWLPAAPTVPLVNLVDDQTVLAISVTDAPALLRGWETSPLATTWSDPQIVKFFAPIREQFKIDQWDTETEAATGLTIRGLLALAKGEVLFAVPVFDFSKLDAKTPPPFLVALEVGEQDAPIRKLLADSLAKENLKEETELYSGVEVHVRPLSAKTEAVAAAGTVEAPAPATISWAIVDGTWLISTEKSRVLSAIDAVKQGGVDAALGKSERFQRTRARVGAAQSLAYINTPAIYPALRDAVAAAKAKSGGSANPMGLDPELIFAALGLDALGECYVALQLDTDATSILGGMLYAEERGLLKLLAYQSGPAVQPNWIPAKWPSVSTARFSVPQAYSALEELLESISPMLSGMAQGQLRTINRQLRVDLKRDLVGSIGNEIVTAYAIPPGLEAGAVPAWTEMDQLLAFSLVNEEAFLKSINALKQLAGPAAEQMFTERDYLGTKLYTLNVPAAAPGAKAPRGFSYALANSMLLVGIGSSATVENSLQGMATGESLFWKREDVKTALADLPADVVGLQLQDLRVLMASIVETLVQLQETANAEKAPDETAKSFVDVTSRPDDDVLARHWGFSSGYVTRTPEGLFSTTRLAHPKK